jgi:hypothetical protein
VRRKQLSNVRQGPPERPLSTPIRLAGALHSRAGGAATRLARGRGAARRRAGRAAARRDAPLPGGAVGAGCARGHVTAEEVVPAEAVPFHVLVADTWARLRGDATLLDRVATCPVATRLTRTTRRRVRLRSEHRSPQAGQYRGGPGDSRAGPHSLQHPPPRDTILHPPPPLSLSLALVTAECGLGETAASCDGGNFDSPPARGRVR